MKGRDTAVLQFSFPLPPPPPILVMDILVSSMNDYRNVWHN